MCPSSLRTYHDPLHGAIVLDASDATEALLIKLIDTPPFQRLRRIRQLGPASLTFHGAESSRFTHSLGVLATTRRAFDGLSKRYPDLRSHRLAVLCAALLHDIGHGPFSHTAEELFGIHHETWTRHIVRQSPVIHRLLTGCEPQLPRALEQIYTHSYPVPLVWQLVSSQLDCDRLDYLMRDSYFTGTNYGHLDLDRILMALEFDTSTGQLVVAQKGLAAIEHYLIVRSFMYGQVYNHPKNLSATWLLVAAFRRARELIAAGKPIADDVVTAWLTSSPQAISLEAYLAADDIVFQYHLQRWQGSEDSLLADLCRRWVNRDLLKTLAVTSLDTSRQHQFLSQLQQHLNNQGIAAAYGGLTHTWSRGYTLYQKGIQIQQDCQGHQRLVDINQVSPLIQTLTHPLERSYILYPRTIHRWVRQQWQAYSRGCI